MNNWKPFDNENLPPANQLVLVYAENGTPQVQVARWEGQGRNFVVSLHGASGIFMATVTHWTEIPQLPSKTRENY